MRDDELKEGVDYATGCVLRPAGPDGLAAASARHAVIFVLAPGVTLERLTAWLETRPIEPFGDQLGPDSLERFFRVEKGGWRICLRPVAAERPGCREHYEWGGNYAESYEECDLFERLACCPYPIPIYDHAE